MTALLANGHVLLEGVPGLAKTLTIKTLSHAIAADFAHPIHAGSLAGRSLGMIFSPKDSEFKVRKGPLFRTSCSPTINRAPAKVQSALLEAYGAPRRDRQQPYPLPELFLVLAAEPH